MKRKLNYEFGSTPAYNYLKDPSNTGTIRSTRQRRMDRPLPEDKNPGWAETGLGAAVIAPGSTIPNPMDKPNQGSKYGGVAEEYWRALAASKGMRGNIRKRPSDWYEGDARPRGRPVLDEEVPKPNSNANPSGNQVPPATVNPDAKPKPTASTPKPVPQADGDDAPDQEDTHVTPLHVDGEDNTGGEDTGTTGSDYGQAGAAGGAENNPVIPTGPAVPPPPPPYTQPPPEIPSIGKPGGNSNPAVATPHIPCTATLTPEEFAELKALVFALHKDIKPTELEQAHTQPGSGPAVAAGGKADDNPQSAYVKPDVSNTDNNKDKDNRRKPKDKQKNNKKKGDGDSSSDKLKTKDQANNQDGPKPKDKGILGMAGLLSSTASFYGLMMGVSSQYVIGTGALALYCLVNVLDIPV